MTPVTADHVLAREYEHVKPEVLRTLRGRLAARGLRFDESDLDAFYNQAWHGVHARLAAGEAIDNRAGMLVVIAERRAIDELRASHPERRADVSELETQLVEPDYAAVLDDHMRVRQLIEGMRERLTPREQQAAALCYVHDYSRPEAAQVLGMSRGRIEKVMDSVSKKVSGLVRDIGDGEWCESRRSLISAYALGLLDPEGPRYMLAVAHLDECSGCRRRVLELRGYASLMPPAPAVLALLAGITGGAGAAAAGTSGGATAAGSEPASGGTASGGAASGGAAGSSAASGGAAGSGAASGGAAGGGVAGSSAASGGAAGSSAVRRGRWLRRGLRSSKGVVAGAAAVTAVAAFAAVQLLQPATRDEASVPTGAAVTVTPTGVAGGAVAPGATAAASGTPGATPEAAVAAATASATPAPQRGAGRSPARAADERSGSAKRSATGGERSNANASGGSQSRASDTGSASPSRRSGSSRSGAGGSRSGRPGSSGAGTSPGGSSASRPGSNSGRSGSGAAGSGPGRSGASPGGSGSGGPGSSSDGSSGSGVSSGGSGGSAPTPARTVAPAATRPPRDTDGAGEFELR